MAVNSPYFHFRVNIVGTNQCQMEIDDMIPIDSLGPLVLIV